LVDAPTRYEHPADDVRLAPGRGADELVIAKLAQAAKIGLERADAVFAFEQEDVVAARAAPDLERRVAEQRRGFGPVAALGRNGRKRQLEPAIRQTAHFEQPRLTRAERHALAAVAVKQDMAACQRRVPAEPNLASGCEPAQLPVSRAGFVAHEKGGLGEVVLLADRLEHVVGKPGFERHDRGLVARKRSGGERVHVPVRQGERLAAGHDLVSSLANSSLSTSLLPGSSTWPSGSMWISRSMPGNARRKSSSTRSMIACASATVIS